MIDLAIIGGGPAGLAAAVYAARAGLDFVVLEQDGLGGGQITASHEVENYPGFCRVSGEALGNAFRRHAETLGADIRFAVVQGLIDHGDRKEILIEDESPLLARAVVAATGAVPRTLNIPGERELLGVGVSYCATCDGAFFRDKDVLVAGGGDTAVEEAIYLSSICRSVTVAVRRDAFRAVKSRVEALVKKKNVSILFSTRLTEIKGQGITEAVVLKSAQGTTERPMDGVFIAVGVEPVSDWLKELPLNFEDGYVVAGEDCRTNIPGIFAAGDLRKKSLRQVVTAAADGANAVYSAVEYLGNVGDNPSPRQYGN